MNFFPIILSWGFSCQDMCSILLQSMTFPGVLGSTTLCLSFSIICPNSCHQERIIILQNNVCYALQLYRERYAENLWWNWPSLIHQVFWQLEFVLVWTVIPKFWSIWEIKNKTCPVLCTYWQPFHIRILHYETESLSSVSSIQ